MESWARLRARCRVDVLAADHRSKGGEAEADGSRRDPRHAKKDRSGGHELTQGN